MNAAVFDQWTHVNSSCRNYVIQADAVPLSISYYMLLVGWLNCRSQRHYRKLLLFL